MEKRNVTDKNRPKEDSQKVSLKNVLKEWIEGGLYGLIVALILTNFVIANTVVPSGSMENTIAVGSRLIGSRLDYKFSQPQRGDIIIFRYPDDKNIYFVKRLIGLPGDRIEFIPDDKGTFDIFINGELYEENYLAGGNKATTFGRSPIYEVPENSYFFLGDNRNYSNDARFWNTQFVSKEDLIAKVYFKYWKGIEWLDS